MCVKYRSCQKPLPFDNFNIDNTNVIWSNGYKCVKCVKWLEYTFFF